MEVNTNFSASGVGGVTPQKPFARAAKTAAATDAFVKSNALDGAVKKLPASRPEAVARARELAADPAYPSADTLRQVSSLLADRLTSENE